MGGGGVVVFCESFLFLCCLLFCFVSVFVVVVLCGCFVCLFVLGFLWVVF